MKTYHKRPTNLFFILSLPLSPSFFFLPFSPSLFIINNRHIRKSNIGNNKINAKPPSPSPINKNLASQFSTIARSVWEGFALHGCFHHIITTIVVTIANIFVVKIAQGKKTNLKTKGSSPFPFFCYWGLVAHTWRWTITTSVTTMYKSRKGIDEALSLNSSLLSL